MVVGGGHEEDVCEVKETTKRGWSPVPFPRGEHDLPDPFIRLSRVRSTHGGLADFSTAPRWVPTVGLCCQCLKGSNDGFSQWRSHLIKVGSPQRLRYSEKHMSGVTTHYPPWFLCRAMVSPSLEGRPVVPGWDILT